MFTIEISKSLRFVDLVDLIKFVKFVSLMKCIQIIDCVSLRKHILIYEIEHQAALTNVMC